MKRLTKRKKDGQAVLNNKCPEGCEYVTCDISEGYQCQHQCEGDIIERLAYYEDLEDQKLLKIFPCKIGDVIYRINMGARNPVVPLYVVELRLKQVGSYIRMKICCSDDYMTKGISNIYYSEDIGEKIFLTKEDATQRVKEME